MPEARAAVPALALALALAACAAAPLAGRTWTLAEIEGQPVAAPGRTTLGFVEDGRVAGDAGCNRYAGPVEIEDGAMTFGALMATKRACEPAVLEQEVRFFEALRQVAAWRLENGALFLLDADDRSLLRFEKGD